MYRNSDDIFHLIFDFIWKSILKSQYHIVWNRIISNIQPALYLSWTYVAPDMLWMEKNFRMKWNVCAFYCCFKFFGWIWFIRTANEREKKRENTIALVFGSFLFCEINVFFRSSPVSRITYVRIFHDETEKDSKLTSHYVFRAEKPNNFSFWLSSVELSLNSEPKREKKKLYEWKYHKRAHHRKSECAGMLIILAACKIYLSLWFPL